MVPTNTKLWLSAEDAGTHEQIQQRSGCLHDMWAHDADGRQRRPGPQGASIGGHYGVVEALKDLPSQDQNTIWRTREHEQLFGRHSASRPLKYEVFYRLRPQAATACSTANNVFKSTRNVGDNACRRLVTGPELLAHKGQKRSLSLRPRRSRRDHRAQRSRPGRCRPTRRLSFPE